MKDKIIQIVSVPAYKTENGIWQYPSIYGLTESGAFYALLQDQSGWEFVLDSPIEDPEDIK